MNRLATRFPTLHGETLYIETLFSMITFEHIDGLFIVYSTLNKKAKNRIKNPDKSWFQVVITK